LERILLMLATCHALYSAKDDVVELTAANFRSKVINSDEVWVVEFFAPWCGHCKNLVPEYKKAATALKGIAKVGAVDMTVHESLGSTYRVQGFPTIKIFAANKDKPIDYNGARTAQGISSTVLAEIKNTVTSRLEGPGQGKGKDDSGSKGRGDVIELTDSNFEKLVLNSKDPWLVEFFAPWCGHCKNLEPHWKAAASQLKGKVKLGALDATVHTLMSTKYGVRGFPTIKYFAPGSSDTDAVDYDGGRTTSDIVSWAESKAMENLPPPEVLQITSQEVVEGQCQGKQLCVFAFLPHILDCQAECRNKYLSILRASGDYFKKNGWGWIWTEGASQPKLEEAFGVGGFGYPAMVALNHRKMKYSTLRGSFDDDGIREFLRDLSYGKGQTVTIKGDALPTIDKVEPWDGKDAPLPVEEEIDLSDVDLEHSEL
uniref:Protein disulfide-isomerase A6 homolog n=1 Tax=Haemonchus placei TaxID=6290 RepID=A0A158QNB7_HAEPC